MRDRSIAVRFQRGDAVLNRGVRRKERTDAARNPEALDGARKFVRFDTAQALQSADHRAFVAHDARGAGVGVVFAVAREIGDHDPGEHAEDDVEHHARHVVADPGAVLFVAKHDAVDHPADEARGKDDEGVHDALQKGLRDHVAVLDVREFMRDDGLDFFAVHEFEKTRGNRHEGARLRGARRKGVGFALIDADFGHRKIRLGALTANDVDEPGFEPRIRIVGVDHREAHAHLRHGLAHEERNDRAREADDHGKDEESPDVETLSGHGAEIDTEDHLHDHKHDREHQKDGEVRQKEKAETLQHGGGTVRFENAGSIVLLFPERCRIGAGKDIPSF